MDIVCTHRPDPVVPGLDRERLYWELSLLTGGFTHLNPYTLDQDSFYVNGEGGRGIFFASQLVLNPPSLLPFSLIPPLLTLFLHIRRLHLPNPDHHP